MSSGKASYRKLTQLSRANPTPRLPWWLRAEESACDTGDMGLTPELGRSPGKGNGNPLQYSCLRNPLDKEEPGGLQSMELRRDDLATKGTSNGSGAFLGEEEMEVDR